MTDSAAPTPIGAIVRRAIFALSHWSRPAAAAMEDAGVRLLRPAAGYTNRVVISASLSLLFANT